MQNRNNMQYNDWQIVIHLISGYRYQKKSRACSSEYGVRRRVCLRWRQCPLLPVRRIVERDANVTVDGGSGVVPVDQHALHPTPLGAVVVVYHPRRGADPCVRRGWGHVSCRQWSICVQIVWTRPTTIRREPEPHNTTSHHQVIFSLPNHSSYVRLIMKNYNKRILLHCMCICKELSETKHKS